MRHLLNTPVLILTGSLIAANVGGAGLAQTRDATVEAHTVARADAQEIPVTVDNFVRAASDFEFEKYVSLAGGINTFFHFRAPLEIDNQPTVRMNRDTLYSSAIVDISEGATLTLPDVGDRYMTTMVVNQDHYLNEVLYVGGSFTLDIETFDTPYVMLFVRTLVDAEDPDDIAAVNAIQDQMVVEANAATPFVRPPYDEGSLAGLIEAILGLNPYIPDSSSMFGSKEEVVGIRHFIGTAGGFGGLPEKDAYYVNVDPGLPVNGYRIDVPADVPVEAFWSLSVYNESGFFQENDLGAYNINSVTGRKNADGSMTVHLGDCEDGRINCLPIMEKWNYTVRLYRPGPEILDGSWTFPEAQPLD